MKTRRGHSPLELGAGIIRPVSSRTGSWKSFPDANWGFARVALACERPPLATPQTPCDSDGFVVVGRWLRSRHPNWQQCSSGTGCTARPSP